MIVKWLDSEILFTIDGELTQFRHGETYEVDTEAKPELTRLLRIKERQGLVEFVSLEGIATFEEEVKPLDLGIPGEQVEGTPEPQPTQTPTPSPAPKKSPLAPSEAQ